jgi:prepilin-type N-terminal cleavage/methylation domain-containing protein
VSKNGFTLIELVYVLVLASVVAAIGLPRLAKSYPQRAVRTAGDQFVFVHTVAQASAIRHGRLAELHVDAAGARFWVEVDTSYAGGAKDTVGLMHHVGEGGVTVTSNRTLLCFDARGLATDRGPCETGDATLTFSFAGTTHTVTTTALGKVIR